MKTSQRPFFGADDFAAMLALASASPDENLHVVDLPYRFCSWALDDPGNISLWTDGRGRLAGWAILQTPFWSVDFAVLPGAEPFLLPLVFEWAEARARAAAETPYGRPAWYVYAFADRDDRLQRLAAAGFTCQADVGDDSWSRVLLRRTAPAPHPAPVPCGFAIRPLAGHAEIEDYVELHRAAFESRNMTAEWRTRTLTAPHHVASTDLVAVDPDGRLAGFCIGWLSSGPDPVGQIEPLGIGREFRERGVGLALLTECARRLTANGAREIHVETDTYRTPALGLYESLGFEPFRDVLVYRRDVGCSTAI